MYRLHLNYGRHLFHTYKFHHSKHHMWVNVLGTSDCKCKKCPNNTTRLLAKISSVVKSCHLKQSASSVSTLVLNVTLGKINLLPFFSPICNYSIY